MDNKFIDLCKKGKLNKIKELLTDTVFDNI